MNKENNTEEVDLGLLFDAIGKLFNRFFQFIALIFKFGFSIIIFGLKAIIDNFKLIGAVLIVAAITGYGLERLKPNIYTSQMLVKPYFDSKYQLVNNIGYFNALISGGDYTPLTEIFQVSEEDVKQLKNFEINIGPESENDRIKQYDNYIKSIDSVLAQDISFDDFIENRDIYSSNFFEISVYSSKKDIFKSLESGLNKSFENTYSAKKMKKRDSLIYIQKQSLINSIKSVDSLQKVYINVLTEESKSQNSSISLGEAFSFKKEDSKTREFDLLEKGIELRNQLRILEEKKVEEDVFFDTVSGFQEVGNISTSIFKKYSIIFPIVSFLILFLIFTLLRTVKFVKKYEA